MLLETLLIIAHHFHVRPLLKSLCARLKIVYRPRQSIWPPHRYASTIFSFCNARSAEIIQSLECSMRTTYEVNRLRSKTKESVLYTSHKTPERDLQYCATILYILFDKYNQIIQELLSHFRYVHTSMVNFGYVPNLPTG